MSPTVVLGQKEQIVLVKHGVEFYRVHPCQLMMVGQNSKEVDKHSLRDVRLPSYYSGKQCIDDHSEVLQDFFK